MRLTGERALEMAGIGRADLDLIDLYSCFPSAVRIGAEEIGLALDDPRGLTVTGGLPYFGGPGNNYALHAIAEMVGKLRERPGAYGLSTANGWFLTKQSVGIYSTKPVEGKWERQPPSVIQAQIDALPHPEIVEKPQGPATIETYTVVHGREGVRMGIVIGRDSGAAASSPRRRTIRKCCSTSKAVKASGGPDGRRRTPMAFATSLFRTEAMTRVHVIRHGKPATTWGGSRRGSRPRRDRPGPGEAGAARSWPCRPAAADKVVSSPLRRCRETAEPLAEALGVEIEIDPRVGEIPTPAALSQAERPAWLRQVFGGAGTRSRATSTMSPGRKAWPPRCARTRARRCSATSSL
jgi:hypothetical protein